MDLPFVKFYPRDWQADSQLRLCSLEARGAWIEMLMVMHSAKRRGYLEDQAGNPLGDPQLVRLIGCTMDELLRAKAELQAHGVPGIALDGRWFSRRMVRDEHKRVSCRDAAISQWSKTQSSNTQNQKLEYQSTRVPYKGEGHSVGDPMGAVVSDVKSIKAQSDGNGHTPPTPSKYASRIEKIRAHDSFSGVSDQAIINKLRGWPEERWDEAIESMIADYAGVHIQVPCRTLGNYLAGKPVGKNGGRVVKDVDYPDAEEAVRRANR